MESKQPTGTLEQVENRSEEEMKTIEGEAKNIHEEDKNPEEQIKTIEKLEQTNQEEIKESEETKAEEAKDTDQEKMTSIELNEQILKIKSLFDNCEQIDEVMKKRGEDKVLKFIRQMKSSSLIEILKGKEYEVLTERMLNSKKIINKIQNFLESLKC